MYEKMYPSKKQDECIETLFERAVYFDNTEKASELFSIMENSNDIDYSTMSYRAKDIKDYKKAIYYKNKTLENITSDWDLVSTLNSIANLFVLDEDYKNAFHTAMKYTKLLDNFDNWKNCGLGRFSTETWFDISNGFINEGLHEESIKAFNLGDNLANKITGISYNILKKICYCSEKLNLSERQKYYEKLRDIEKKRIDAEINRKIKD